MTDGRTPKITTKKTCISQKIHCSLHSKRSCLLKNKSLPSSDERLIFHTSMKKIALFNSFLKSLPDILHSPNLENNRRSIRAIHLPIFCSGKLHVVHSSLLCSTLHPSLLLVIPEVFYPVF